jgi:hypothetical protein
MCDHDKQRGNLRLVFNCQTGIFYIYLHETTPAHLSPFRPYTKPGCRPTHRNTDSKELSGYQLLYVGMIADRIAERYAWKMPVLTCITTQ